MVATGFGPEGPTTTVILATYNQPHWLELALAALSVQTDPRFDVIVADDGSAPPAAVVVDRLRGELPFEIGVVEQEDRGFRKARIQNLAALQTDAELLVFLDGDCLAFRTLLEVYRRSCVREQFHPGAVSYLDQATTDRLTVDLVRRAEHEQSLTIREALRIRGVHWKNLWHAGRKETRPRFKGGNFAVAAELFRRVDGFDEVYCGFAKEDSDLRNRMRNTGARGRSLWHRARVAHLAWARPFGRGREYPPPEMYDEGRTRVRARVGMSSHTREGARPRTLPGGGD